jgi:hypothetical protein
MQDAGEPREGGPEAPLIGGEPFEGERRGMEHGVVREALMRADEGSERLRHGEGEEEVRPGPRLFEVGFKPLLGFRLLTLGAVAVAPGMMDAVVFPTAGALREAVSVVAALTVLDGAEDLAGREGEGGVTLKGFWRKGGADITEGGHGRSPCMRALRRS